MYSGSLFIRKWCRRVVGTGLRANIAFTFATQLFLLLLALVSGSVLARVLGPEGRGELAAIQNVGGFLGFICTLGLAESALYYTAKKIEHSATILITTCVIATVFMLPIIGIVYLALPYILSSQSALVVSLARWYLWLVPINIYTLISHGVLRGTQRLDIWNVLRLLSSVAWLALIVVMWLLGQSSVGFLVVGFVLSMGTLLILTIIMLFPYVQGTYAFSREMVSSLVRYGLPSLFASVPSWMTLRVDQLIMAAFLAPEQLGFYAVAASWTGSLTSIGVSVASAIFPEMARNKEAKNQTTIILKTTRQIILVSLLVSVPFLLITPLAVRILFGDAFLAAIPVAFVLIPANMIWGVKLVFADTLRGVGLPSRVMRIELLGIVLALISIWLLLPIYGILGAAFASLISYGVITLFLAASVKKHISCRFVEFLPTTNDAREAGNVLRRVLSRIRPKNRR